MSYRFLRDGKDWRMLVSTETQGAVAMEHLPSGLRVDVNADHLALTRMDGYGNSRGTQTHRWSLPENQ